MAENRQEIINSLDEIDQWARTLGTLGVLMDKRADAFSLRTEIATLREAAPKIHKLAAQVREVYDETKG